VDQLFYPDAPPSSLSKVMDDEGQGTRYRAKKFLAALTVSEYHAAYRFVHENADEAFPDIEAILSRGRDEGRIVSQVVSQVARWINATPTAVGTREKNKPAHWEDFIPALRAMHGEEEAGRIAQQLQRDIFDVVRGRWDELEGSLEGDVSQPSYLARFSSPIWHELLVLVHRVVGPRFVGQLVPYNGELPPPVSRHSKPALIQSIGEAVGSLPQVKGNPALRTRPAIDQLMKRISPLIAEWAVEWCDQELKAQDDQRVPRWRPSILRQVREERLALGEFAQGHAPTAEDTNSATGLVESTEISPQPSDEGSSRSPDPPALISALLPPDADALAARRKALRENTSRPQRGFTEQPVAKSRNRLPAMPTSLSRPSWMTGPVARP
jgi:hypothetical protein